MTTINATKGEFVNLINGLFQVQELKGKNFGLVVRKKLQHLEELGKPSEEFMKLAVQVNEIAANDPDGSKEIIDQLEEDNKELVEKRREQMENVTERMKEKMSVKLKTLSTDILPEDITAQQISNLEQIIK